MKKITALFCAGVFISALCAGCGGGDVPLPEPLPDEPVVLTDASKYDNYYMSAGQKIMLTKMSDKSYVVFKDSDTQIITEKLAATGAEIEQVSPLNMSSFENSDSSLLNCSWAVVSANYDDVSKISELIYATPAYETRLGRVIGISHELQVALKNRNDLAMLKKLAEDNNMLFLGRDKDEELYWLACTKESTGNALQVVNWLFEMDWIERVYQSILERPTINKNTIL